MPRSCSERAESEAQLLAVRDADARERGGRRRSARGASVPSLVGEVLAGFGAAPRHSYVCGSTAFVDSATRLLLDMDVPFPSIRTERYGGDPARHDASGPPGP